MCIEYKVIGRHIRTARKQKKMTQEAVAEAIEMSCANYGKVERGQRKVNLPRLAQLSIALDVPIESLIAGSVVLPDGAFYHGGIEPQAQSTFPTAMENIAKGCSEDSLRLMLQLCAVIAQEDKSKKDKL